MKQTGDPAAPAQPATAVSISPLVLKENEFRASELPTGSALLVGAAAVFNVDGTFCATQAAIIEAFPRLGMKEQFTHAVCRIAETRPATTYDNFARDFGERFVPGYKPASTVDYLLNSPFTE